MRRQEREITDKSLIDQILQSTDIIRLGFVENGMAYIVPVNFAHEGDTIWLHGAYSGKKAELILQNPIISFEADTAYERVTADSACGYSARYQSVMGMGHIRFADSDEEKVYGLNVLMQKHSGRTWEYPEAMLKRTAVMRIDILSITGKQANIL